MHKISIIVISLVVLALGCSKSHENLLTLTNAGFNDTALVAYQECILSADNKVTLCLDSLLSESRCPIEADCIWAGNATVRFIINVEGKKTSFDLNTNTEFINDTIVDGYSIRLIGLQPYPSIKIQAKPTDYIAQLSITAIKTK